MLGSRARATTTLLVAVVLVGTSCGDDKPEVPAGARETTIEGSSGELDAVEMGEGTVGVVLVHGASTGKELWFPLMPALADAGMRAVACDLGDDRTGDVRAVRAYLEDAGASQIVLVGSSLGASDALDVASDGDVAAVVTFSVGGGEGPVDVRGLYIASEGDGDTADVAESLAAEFGGEAIIVDGDTHGADLLKPHPEVVDDVVSFIRDATSGG